MGFWPYTVDDAYITLRHARNLVEGFGFVFNPNGQNVESYTNHLLFLWQAFAIYLGADGLYWTKVLGVTSGVLTLLGALGICLVLFISQKDTEELSSVPVAGFAVVTLILSRNPTLISGSVSGLETALFTALITWGALISIVLLREKMQMALIILHGVLYGLATWTRPEGIAWLLGFNIAILAYRIYQKYDWKRFLISPAIAFGFWISLTSWRLVIFGHPFPNTYYAKMFKTLENRLDNGVVYVQSYLLQDTGLILLLFCIAGFFTPSPKARWCFLILFASILGGLALPAYEGGDWIPHYRMISPVVGILTACSIASLVLFGTRFSKAASYLAVICPLIVFAVQYPKAKQAIYNANAEIQTRVIGWNDSHKPLGIWLGEWNDQHIIREGESLTVALADIGLVGWHGRVDIIDLAGLADPYWAHLKYNDPDASYPVDWLLNEKEPDVIVLLSNSVPGQSKFNALWNGEQIIYDATKFQETYREAVKFTHKDFPGDSLFLHVFVHQSLWGDYPKVTPPEPRAVRR